MFREKKKLSRRREERNETELREERLLSSFSVNSLVRNGKRFLTNAFEQRDIK